MLPSLSHTARRAIRRLPVVGPAIDYLRRSRPILSEGDVAAFHGAGYMVFDPELSEADLDQAVRDLMGRPGMKEATHHGTRWFNGWKESPAIRRIALASRVLRALRQLYGREPMPFQTLNFPIGTEQKVHSDTIHFNCDPPTYMCGVWVALEDIDMNNGALLYYPGSHRLPVVTMEDFAPGPGVEHYPRYEEYVAQLVREKGLEPAYGVLKKGQALIWSANLFHGGSAHHDKARTRHSQVTHYYFEGCQYYMPLESYGGYRHLRFEDWIR